MNKKLIAAAVSAAVVAPVAAQAEVSVYGRINNAIDTNDIDAADDADSTTDISGVSSRFGIKYDQEIGSGYSAHGRYEFSTNTDNERGINDARIATVGLSGPAGRIDVGNQWSSYFNTFGTLVSPTYSLGYYIYSSVGGGLFRGSNTIKYSNTFGPVYLELDARLNESDEGADVAEKARGDGFGLGLSFAVHPNITIAIAADSEDGADDQAAVEGVNAVVSPGYNPGNEERRGAVTVDVLSADGNSTTETTFVAVTEADTGGGDITADQVNSAVAEAGRVVTPAGASAVAEGDNPDTDRFGVAIKWTGGGYWAALGFQNYEVDENERTGAAEVDVDTTFLYGGGKFAESTSWMLGYSVADDEADAVADVAGVGSTTPANQVRGSLGSLATDDSSSVVWGIYHNMGGGIKVYWEGTDLDSENKNWDGARHFLGMRVDF